MDIIISDNEAEICFFDRRRSFRGQKYNQQKKPKGFKT